MRRELITFELSGQLFGIDIMAIREIRAWSPVTVLPRVPDHVAGVVNLRGAVLPVIDLSVRLGWPATEATPRNPIIVVEHEGQSRGLIVHGVNDIVSIEADSLQQPDGAAQARITGFLEGLAPLDDNMVMVLDLAELMADEELELAA
ncbi:chemotaxis protein CheW [Alteraurantiacibacter aquimixticola]|uniref:Purine-binding chemotaxis protein CheW n=1 Tax=Alteraurantiacibacter aquimixticola TaxID=2489173 RepID=A0A4T3EX41_9SPHN|nr:chemotaxis protein CheW [Alteraurantiacibacter aquimixticola]TIX49073.1 purine-binding chemotaxis protein CheW [Alteraurantiacibacter aquimixticola]